MADWKIDPNLRKKLIAAIDELLTIRHSQIGWLERFINDVNQQQIIINSAKTVSTVIAIASSIALFTPLALVGVVGLAASGVAGFGVTLGDFIANEIKNSNLKKELNESKTVEDKLSNLLEELIQAAEKLSQQLGCTLGIACRLVLYMKEIHDISVDKGDSYLQLSKDGVIAIIDIVAAVSGLKKITDAVNFGYGFYNAAKISTAASVAMVVEGREAVYQLAGAAVGLASKGVAIVGSGFGVFDVIYSWLSDNPNLTSAKQCLKKVKESKSKLEAMRKDYDVKFEDL